MSLEVFPHAAISEAVAAADDVRRAWLSDPNVTAIDVGYRIQDDVLQEELAIRVHVRRKRPVEVLPKEDVINDRASPKLAGGFPLDVIEAVYEPHQQHVAAGEVPVAAAQTDRRNWFSPLVGGISIGNPRATAGTLGAVVRDLATGAPMVLSNHHVLAGSRSARVGEGVLQPGAIDGGTDADVVAQLERMRFDNDADAAIARLTIGAGQRDYTECLLGLPQRIVGISPVRWPLGVEVVKSGRSTGMTEGVIDGVALFVRLGFPAAMGGTHWMRGQIHIARRPKDSGVLSSGGDSGATWIGSESGLAVALHVGGSTVVSPHPYALGTSVAPLANWLGFSFEPVFIQQRHRIFLGALTPPPVIVTPPIPEVRSTTSAIGCAAQPPVCGCGTTTLLVGNGALITGRAEPVAPEVGGSGHTGSG